jgi:hypothetical protein
MRWKLATDNRLMTTAFDYLQASLGGARFGAQQTAQCYLDNLRGGLFTIFAKVDGDESMNQSFCAQRSKSLRRFSSFFSTSGTLITSRSRFDR